MDAQAQVEGEQPAERGAVAWILRHDESRAFVFLYVGLALVLSIAFGLFWLVAVVGIHLLFETLKQHRVDSRPGRLAARVLWELKLDLALILFALCLSIYLDVVLGIAGLGAAARAGVAGGTRFVAWQKILRAVLLSMDDAAQVVRALLGRKKKAVVAAEPSAKAEAEPAPSEWGGWGSSWSLGDRFALALGGLCLLFIALGPWLTPHTALSLAAMLLGELHPFP